MPKLCKQLYWWSVCNTLFWAGHLVSLIMHHGDSWHMVFAKLYHSYNWLMAKSVEINDKHGLNIWQPWEDKPDD